MWRMIALAAVVAWLHAGNVQVAASPAARPGFGGYISSLINTEEPAAWAPPVTVAYGDGVTRMPGNPVRAGW